MDMLFGNNCKRSGNEKNRMSQLPNKEKIHEIKQHKLWHDDFYNNLEKD